MYEGGQYREQNPRDIGSTFPGSLVHWALLRWFHIHWIRAVTFTGFTSAPAERQAPVLFASVINSLVQIGADSGGGGEGEGGGGVATMPVTQMRIAAGLMGNLLLRGAGPALSW